MKSYFSRILLFALVFIYSCSKEQPRRAEVLFFGAGHESSSNYATWLAVELFKTGVNLTYTTNLEDMNTEYLNKYDGVVLLVNEQELDPEQSSALEDYLEDGHGLVSMNTSANSFTKEPWYQDLVKGGYENKGGGAANVTFADSSVVIGNKYPDFRVVDELYQFRNNKEAKYELAVSNIGNGNQPYMWAEEVGRGRFFYSAIGGKDATWKNLSFLRALSDGIWWSLGPKVKNLVDELKIPNVSIYADTIADFTARYDVPKMQDPLESSESMKLIQKPVDFELKLFASEPNIVNPIAMSWDHKGRLWVIESVDYPNSFADGGKGNDKIKICEDTDGDGVADKFTVFADSLNIGTSLTFMNDGVLVAMAPDFLFLKDTDGDDKADVREVFMTGWSKHDTHAGPSNLQYGFDNKIWGVTGYAGFNGEIKGVPYKFGQGVYRFNTDGSGFEYLATTSNNTWGLGISEDNNVFISTANNTHSAFYSLPERFLQRRVFESKPGSLVNAVQKIDGHYDVHALTPNLRQVDVVGGFTSAAGHQMYTAREFPKSYWNRIAFVTEPTVRLVHNAIIDPEGAGFKESDGWNLLASSDEWFGPLAAEVGPDGAVWVLDWYNFIIQHNVFVPAQAPSEKVLPFVEQPHGQGNAFESDLRDKKFGRVYRVVYKDAKHNESYKLSKDDPKELIKALKSKNKFWRMHAQRLLVERQKTDVRGDLIKLINDDSKDEIGLNPAAIHAIWTAKGLGLLKDKNVLDAVIQALNHPSAGVRKAAVQALELDNNTIKEIAKSNIFKDENLNTRLAAFVKIAESKPIDGVYEILVSSLKDTVNQNDRWLSPALFAAVQTNEELFRKNGFHDMSTPYLTTISHHLIQETYKIDRRRRMQFSPDIKNKDIIIQVQLQKTEGKPFNGLILGQGDSKEGYALYTENNKVYWQINASGKKEIVSSPGVIPDNSMIRAELTKENGMSLYVNSKLVASNKGISIFANPLNFYLRSGQDFEAPFELHTYGQGSEFTGNINELIVNLKPTTHVHRHAGMDMGTSEENVKPTSTIVIKAVKDLMQYDKRTIAVTAGTDVTLVFENTDAMMHNLLIIKPNSLESVGKAADEMLKLNNAMEKSYVPDNPNVLFHTNLVNPGESFTLKFKAPKEAGDYPYVCTFPGHWRGMNGIMKVVNK